MAGAMSKSSSGMVHGGRHVSIQRQDLLFGLLAWLFIPVLYLIQGQDVNFDLQNYHLYNSISFFESGFSRDTAAAGIQSYFNPLVSIPAYVLHRLAQTTTQRMIAGLALACFQGLCGALTYGIARATLLLQPAAAALVTLFGLSSPILVAEAGTTFGDLTLCVLQLGAVALALLARQERDCSRSQWQLAIAWGLMGASCGIKFSAVFALPVLLALCWTGSGPIRSARQKPWALALGFVLSFILFAWPWLSRSLADHGNPFYPLFSSLFGHSPLLNVDNHADVRFLKRGLLAMVKAPLDDLRAIPKQRAEMIYRDLRTSLWFYASLASLAVMAMTRFRQGERQSLQFVNVAANTWTPLQLGSVIAYLIWIRTAGIGRYILPLQALSGILLFMAIAILFTAPWADRRQSLTTQAVARGQQRYMIIWFALLTAIVLRTTIVPSWGRVPLSQPWNVLHQLDVADQRSGQAFPIKSHQLFGGHQQIVLFAKPLAWLKQYEPDHAYHLLDNKKDQLRDGAIRRLIYRVKASGGKFTAIDFVDNSFLKSHTVLTPLQNSDRANRFVTGECRDFSSGFGRSIRACDAELLQASLQKSKS